MLGYLVEKSGVVSRESVQQAIRSSLKQKIIDLNLQALDAGIELAQSDAAS
jgi:Pyruvate/2-oxoacid:ferredoxin oxidoreductase gamma subunit